MHKKTRGANACLYRSHWVPKGTQGNTHGYAVQSFVASLPLSAECMPAALAAKLSASEAAYVEAVICRPARERAEQLRQEVEQREADPIWRLTEAVRLIRDAALRSHDCEVPARCVQLLSGALKEVRTSGPAEVSSEPVEIDPLSNALLAAQLAACAVRDGTYGDAPEESIRSTSTYKRWAEIYETVCGQGPSSLLRALQDRGFAKSRQR